MNRINHILVSAATAAIAIFSFQSCTNEPTWGVGGKIEGAKDGNVILEAMNENGYWYALDTLSISGDGTFNGEGSPTPSPTIYRLNYNNRYIYFPIDSLDRINVEANATNFDNGYTLSGSTSAEMMMHVDKRINDFLSRHKIADLDTARMLKRELSGMVLGEPSGIVAYYIVNKQVQGHRIFRPSVRNELAIIGAVANAYNEFKPDDPRTKYLASIWLSNRPRSINPTDTIAAAEISILDINLIDDKGKKKSLESIAHDNKIVILNFTGYKADFSQALNHELRAIYDTYHNNGLEIYQVGVDDNEFDWRIAAGNLPWVTVFNGTTDEYLLKYNVSTLPTSFIINNGEIVERINDHKNIRSAVSRFF